MDLRKKLLSAEAANFGQNVIPNVRFYDPNNFYIPSSQHNHFEKSFQQVIESNSRPIHMVPSISECFTSNSPMFPSTTSLPLPPGMRIHHCGPDKYQAEFTTYDDVKMPNSIFSDSIIHNKGNMPSYMATKNSSGVQNMSTPITRTLSLNDPKKEEYKRSRCQERNRLAAMKSRQRKKKEWERLVTLEAHLAQENAVLKEEISRLKDEILKLSSVRE